MLSLTIGLLLLFLSVSVTSIILFKRQRLHKNRARKSTIDAYKLRADLSIKQEIVNLYRTVLGAYYSSTRKSPILMMAEQFKKRFGLGRFALFCADKNMLMPFMSAGFNLRSLKALKVEVLNRLIPSKGDIDRARGSNGAGLAISRDIYESLAPQANLPPDLNQPFVFYYNFDAQQILFVGEDPQKNLARYCAAADFNKSIWPLFVDIFKANNNARKLHQKIRALQDGLSRTTGELEGLNRKLKHKITDLHSFYGISNELFTIYDEQRLLEAFAGSVQNMVNAGSVVILKRDDKNRDIFKWSLGLKQKKVPLELPVESQIYKLLAASSRALNLPVVVSGLPEKDEFVEEAMRESLYLMEKLNVGQEIYGVVLLGSPGGNGSYSEADIELFSTLTNMASLALGNISQYAMIEKMSYTDSMTEIFNYRYFYKRLNEEVFRAERFNRMLSLVIFDIDNFKTFNDTYGHQIGDEVLKKMAEFVTSSVRAIDVVSRYGGEEFCIIMPDTGFANCLIFIERLRKRIEGHKFTMEAVKTNAGAGAEPLPIEKGYNITVSIGGAIYPNDAQTADRLIYCADMALLKAKAEGRNRAIMFTSSFLDDEKLKASTHDFLTDLGIHEDI